MADISRLTIAKVERDFLEPADITKLIEAAEAPADTIISLAAYSGLRRGELFALQWGDLDETHAVLHIRRSNYQGAITTPKTEHSHRNVDLPTRIVTLLQEYRKSIRR
jgi:integrase